MKEKIKNQQLFIFLAEHNAWEKFTNNVENFIPVRLEHHMKPWLKYLEEVNDPNISVWHCLQHGFLWRDTPEGYDYWHNLSNKAFMLE